jgi:hypothetical protein
MIIPIPKKTKTKKTAVEPYMISDKKRWDSRGWKSKQGSNAVARRLQASSCYISARCSPKAATAELGPKRLLFILTTNIAVGGLNRLCASNLTL